MRRNLFPLLLAGCMVGNVMAEPFDAFERTIPELQAAMETGAVTSQELVHQYLARIEAFDDAGPALNAMLFINPHALDDAAALDRERAEQGARGPLHGIPIVLKDNYDTFDMPTTAGSIAMQGFVPADDAYQVRKLREAGAIIVGKTNLHEFARGIETVSSLGGYTRNPYDPGRNPGGSSGGTAAAVAANFAVVGTGSDTCGSIRIPAANNNLYGLRVTQGLSNMDGIVPLSHTQDVAGPLARSMIDLVTVLDATIDGAAFSENLDANALDGARLGLLTDYLVSSEEYAEVSQVVRHAATAMEKYGATVVDLQIDDLDEISRGTGVIDYEFASDLASYLQAADAPVGSLDDVMESGQYHEALERRYRRSLERANDDEEYRKRLARRPALARLLVDAMDEHQLDAIVYPTLRTKPVAVGESQSGSLCRLAAHSGLPAISLPAGFTDDGVPVGIELLARSHEDGRLVALGFAWEQKASPRRPPATTPSLIGKR
jgi:Asp-tRNA(Asn)/Glu-tRNA(Gln) amidotransferase A subunit family amidase